MPRVALALVCLALAFAGCSSEEPAPAKADAAQAGGARRTQARGLSEADLRSSSQDLTRKLGAARAQGEVPFDATISIDTISSAIPRGPDAVDVRLLRDVLIADLEAMGLKVTEEQPADLSLRGDLSMERTGFEDGSSQTRYTVSLKVFALSPRVHLVCASHSEIRRESR